MKAADILAAHPASDGKTVRIGNAIFPVPAQKPRPKPKKQKFLHLSAPLVRVKGPDGLERLVPVKGKTYNVGRNASKRKNRRADIRARVAARSVR